MVRILKERNPDTFMDVLDKFAELVTNNYHKSRNEYFKHVFFPEYTSP